MQSFFETLQIAGTTVWQASWQAACLAVLIWALLSILGGRIAARWRFVLWSLVFVRLALPVLPASPTSGFRWLPDRPMPVVAAVHQERELNSQPDGRSDGLTEAFPETFAQHQLVSETHFAPATDTPADHSANQLAPPPAVATATEAWWTWGMAASAVWLMGVFALGGRRVAQQVVLRRRIRRWRSVDDEKIASLLAACRRRLGVRSQVAVRVSEDGTGPAITGLWLPQIVMPAEVLREFSDQQLEMILLHELAHVRRRDLLVQELCLSEGRALAQSRRLVGTSSDAGRT